MRSTFIIWREKDILYHRRQRQQSRYYRCPIWSSA